MGLRFQKRVNLGSGTGLNLSKGGVSPSIRSKYGSIGTRGFSLRTGIPGLSFRSSSKNALPVIIVLAVITGIALVAVNLFYFIVWLFGLIFSTNKVKDLEQLLQSDLVRLKNDPKTHFAKFSIDTIPEEHRAKTIVINDLLVENGSVIEANQPIMELLIDNSIKGKVSAQSKGTITFYKLQDHLLVDGEYLFRIND